MALLIEEFGLLPGWLLGALFVFMRYLLFAGLAFAVFYVLWRRAFAPHKIQQRPPDWGRMGAEIGHSALTALVFALVGLGVYGLRKAGFTAIYTELGAYGWGYLAFSFFLLTVIHDTYFYWMHRVMHHPRVFRRVHAVHHRSFNPTPWTSLAFHPIEAVLEVAIVPLAILWIPFHPLVLFVFASWALFFNVMGHLGFELFPAWLADHPLGRWVNTATHHNLHHERSGCHYGLYYNFWDRIMGTNHPDYERIFKAVAAGRVGGNKKSQEKPGL